MTTTSRQVSSLTAHIEERLLAPLRRDAFARRTWFLVVLSFALFLHGTLLALLLYRDTAAPRMTQQETPVEVIVEPPKSEPKPLPKKPEAPKAQAKAEIEKPASSAPRAPNEDKIDTSSLDKETHAPKAPTPPKDGKPEPNEAASPSDAEAKPDDAEPTAEAKPDVLKDDAEALAKAAPLPPKRPEIVKQASRAKLRRPKSAVDKLAGASTLPDYTFARPSKKSRVYGGTEDSRYLSIVFGMIMASRPRVSFSGSAASVTIAFTLDEDGELVGMGVERSSGSDEIDAAAAQAIRRAAPFPPLPPGAPHGLVATVDFSRAAPVYTMGDEGR